MRTSIVCCVLLFSGLIMGCVMQADRAYSQAEAEPVPVKRMGVVDSIYTKAFDQNHYQSMSFRLYIIKVDNKEYIVNSRGGIVEHKND